MPSTSTGAVVEGEESHRLHCNGELQLVSTCGAALPHVARCPHPPSLLHLITVTELTSTHLPHHLSLKLILYQRALLLSAAILCLCSPLCFCVAVVAGADCGGVCLPTAAALRFQLQVISASPPLVEAQAPPCSCSVVLLLGCLLLPPPHPPMCPLPLRPLPLRARPRPPPPPSSSATCLLCSPCPTSRTSSPPSAPCSRSAGTSRTPLTSACASSTSCTPSTRTRHCSSRTQT